MSSAFQTGPYTPESALGPNEMVARGRNNRASTWMPGSEEAVAVLASAARRLIKSAPQAAAKNVRRRLTKATKPAKVQALKGLGNIDADYEVVTLDDLDESVDTLSIELAGLGYMAESLTDGELLAGINDADGSLLDEIEMVVDGDLMGLGKAKKKKTANTWRFNPNTGKWAARYNGRWNTMKTSPPAGATIIAPFPVSKKKAKAARAALPPPPPPPPAARPAPMPQAPTVNYTIQPAMQMPSQQPISYPVDIAPSWSGQQAPAPFIDQSAPQAPIAPVFETADGEYLLPEGEQAYASPEGFFSDGGEYFDSYDVEAGYYMDGLGQVNLGFFKKIGKALKKVAKVALPVAAGLIPVVGPLAQGMVSNLVQGKQVLDASGVPLLPPQTGKMVTLKDGRRAIVNASNKVVALLGADGQWRAVTAAPAPRPGTPGSGNSTAPGSAFGNIPPWAIAAGVGLVVILATKR